MQLDIAGLTEQGGRSANEDAWGQWSGPWTYFAVVADGAGGHRGGPVASRLAVNVTLTALRGTRDCTPEAVESAMKSANEAVVREQKARVRFANMRTTLVALAVDVQRAHAAWGHLGDSRLYVFRDARIVAQTRDHSVVQTMVDAGYLQPEQLRTSPTRSQLLGALGDQDQFNPAIQRQTFPIRSGDKFLLCTDGLWEYVQESEMEQTLGACNAPQSWLEALQGYITSRAKSNHDNYTAVAVWCR